MTEIDQARQRLEADLRELEERLPEPLRSIKSLVGLFLGTAILGVFLLRRFAKRSRRTPAAEVVVRIVREDRGHPSRG